MGCQEPELSQCDRCERVFSDDEGGQAYYCHEIGESKLQLSFTCCPDCIQKFKTLGYVPIPLKTPELPQAKYLN